MNSYFEIKNNWDNKTFCGLDLAWVNDGRLSSCFKTYDEAQDALSRMSEEDQGRCAVVEIVVEIED